MAKKEAAKKTEAPAPAETPSKELAPSKGPAQTKAVAKTGTRLANRGFENLDRQDLILPRLKLLQSMSKEVTEGDQEVGSMLNNLSNKNYGKKITVVPILHFRSQIKFNPLDEGGGIDCSAPDAKTPRTNKYAKSCAECPHREWKEADGKKGKENTPPACTRIENFVCFVNGELEPVIISFSNTKTKVAKRWWSGMSLKNADMFNFQYVIDSVKEKTDDFTYFNFKITDPSKKTPPELIAQAEKIWESLSSASEIKVVDEAGIQSEDAGAEKETAAVGKY